MSFSVPITPGLAITSDRRLDAGRCRRSLTLWPNAEAEDDSLYLRDSAPGCIFLSTPGHMGNLMNSITAPISASIGD